jgi:hypothetical protein
MRAKVWVVRHGRYAVRMDANRPGVYPWVVWKVSGAL